MRSRERRRVCSRTTHAMVDFAKSPGITNEQALIANAVAYRRHPRNALNVNGVAPSTLFCERRLVTQLNRVVTSQLQGVDPGLFGSPVLVCTFGQSGTCPFGQTLTWQPAHAIEPCPCPLFIEGV
ncbi:hypothetical protein BGY98DRAFT_1117708 [Russula aff. rugulosa BPL654]|nr:hypothetical protein BGY98DRAFT_1117708 [Russula aff. rugulosa BPL654]